jgi:hypothetical protein
MRQPLTLRSASGGTWLAVGLTVVLAVMNLWKLIAGEAYPYGYPDYSAYQMDPWLGFATGVLALMACGVIMAGLLRGDVWPAIAAAVLLPLLYLMTFQATAAVPAVAMALVFGVQAVSNYRRKFRRLT